MVRQAHHERLKLTALAVGLVGTETARALQPSFHRWIRDGEDLASIEIDIVEREDMDIYLPLSKDDQISESQLKIELKKSGREIKLQVVGEIPHPQEFWNDTPFANISPEWFICGYGPFRRLFGASFDAIRRMDAPNTENFVTLFDESASLAEVDQWLKHLHHKALEQQLHKKRAIANNESEGEEDWNLHLEWLLTTLRDEFLPNQITVDRVDSDGLWLRDKNGVELAWTDMSDGYRASLALLIDIFKNMVRHYYFVYCHPKKNPDGKPFFERSGVVLIDEVDAHLHPEWQQKIGFWLKRHFPNIQFLVTTHSPIICQAADDNGLFVLPEPGSQDKPKALSKEEYNKIIASRPDTILLTSAFGLQNTRSPRAVEGRAEFAKLKAKRRAGAQLTPEEDAHMRELEIFGENEEEL